MTSTTYPTTHAFDDLIEMMIEADRFERIIERPNRLAELREQRAGELRASIAQTVALWDLTAFPAGELTTEHDGRSHADDNDDHVPYEMQAVELSPTPGMPWGKDPWWILTRALNRSEFVHTFELCWVHRVQFTHPVLGPKWIADDPVPVEMGEPDEIDGAQLVQVWAIDRGKPSQALFIRKAYPAARAELDRRNRQTHLESRRSSSLAHLRSSSAVAYDWDGTRDPNGMPFFRRSERDRGFYQRAAIEQPFVHSNHDRDGGDYGIAAVEDPVTGRFYTVRWEKRFLHTQGPKAPRHLQTWMRLKWQGGKGPKLGKGSWVKAITSIIPATDVDQATDQAWQWASEIDLVNEAIGAEGHLDLADVLAREASDEDWD